MTRPAVMQPLRGSASGRFVYYPGCAARPWAIGCDPFGAGLPRCQLPSKVCLGRWLGKPCPRRAMIPAAFQPFLEQTPLCVLARAVLERLFLPSRLDQLFRAAAQRQYEQDLLFSQLA